MVSIAKYSIFKAYRMRCTDYDTWKKYSDNDLFVSRVVYFCYDLELRFLVDRAFGWPRLLRIFYDVITYFDKCIYLASVLYIALLRDFSRKSLFLHFLFSGFHMLKYWILATVYVDSRSRTSTKIFFFLWTKFARLYSHPLHWLKAESQ